MEELPPDEQITALKEHLAVLEEILEIQSCFLIDIFSDYPEKFSNILQARLQNFDGNLWQQNLLHNFQRILHKQRDTRMAHHKFVDDLLKQAKAAEFAERMND